MPDRRLAARAGFTLALLGVVAALAMMTWPISSTSYRVPAFILLPTAILLVVQLARDLRETRTVPAFGDTAVLGRAFAWLLFMPVLLAATGLVYGGAIYTLAYQRFGNRDSWTSALVSALAVGSGLALVAHGLRMPQLFVGPIW